MIYAKMPDELGEYEVEKAGDRIILTRLFVDYLNRVTVPVGAAFTATEYVRLGFIKSGLRR